MKKNKVGDIEKQSQQSCSANGQASQDGIYRKSGASNVVLYVGLGMIAIGLIITFVGMGDRGFNTIELKLIGPSLIGSGVFFCLLRICFCTFPYCCRQHCKWMIPPPSKPNAEEDSPPIKSDKKSVSFITHKNHRHEADKSSQDDSQRERESICLIEEIKPPPPVNPDVEAFFRAKSTASYGLARYLQEDNFTPRMKEAYQDGPYRDEVDSLDLESRPASRSDPRKPMNLLNQELRAAMVDYELTRDNSSHDTQELLLKPDILSKNAVHR